MRILNLMLGVFILTMNGAYIGASETNTLWYTAPADDSGRSVSVDKARWAARFPKEALPLGNGRLGWLPHGGVTNEFVEFNEYSLWIGDEAYTGAYQAFGFLDVKLKDHDQAVQEYRRELDIAQSLHSVTYRMDDVNYHREYFASNPAEVLVFRFTADRKGALNATIKLGDYHKGNGTTASPSSCILRPIRRTRFRGSTRNLTKPTRKNTPTRNTARASTA